MKTRSVGLVRTCNYVAAISLLVIAVLQFLPFWYNGEIVASIQDYIWFPKENKELNNYFKELTENPAFRVNDIILMPVLMVAGSVIGFLVCILKSRSVLSAIFPAACGLIGIVGYLSSPVFQAFEYWWMHVAVCAELVLISATTFYVGMTPDKKAA